MKQIIFKFYKEDGIFRKIELIQIETETSRIKPEQLKEILGWDQSEYFDFTRLFKAGDRNGWVEGIDLFCKDNASHSYDAVTGSNGVQPIFEAFAMVGMDKEGNMSGLSTELAQKALNVIEYNNGHPQVVLNWHADVKGIPQVKKKLNALKLEELQLEIGAESSEELEGEH